MLVENTCNSLIPVISGGRCFRSGGFDGTKYIYGDVRVAVSADKKIDIQSPFPLDLVFIY